MQSSYDFLLIERDGPIAVVTMNRPDRRNALSVELMSELIDCLTSLGKSSEIRTIILAAKGPAFSSGHDLNELRDQTITEYRHVFDVCTDLMTLIQKIPQPIIAEVAGIATAAGCQLVAACDLAVAAESATFATPGVRIGLFCTTPMVALTRAVGRKHALEMLLTGAAITAQTAEAWGLVNRVVPASRLRDETRGMAAQIADASPVTVSIGKQAFYAQIDLDQPKAYSYAKEIMTLNSMAEDAQEGIEAFLSKRKPCWRGL
jgi:enoyl-CoA hydratase/carnithine racemase